MKSNEISKTSQDSEAEDDIRPEYDFSNAVRGKYAGRIHEETVMITLAPDVAPAFPDADSVNEALRLLLKTAKSAVSKSLPAA